MRRMKTISLLLVFLPPWSAWSEGAVRLLDCSYVQACDGAGACVPEKGAMVFRLEPRTIQSDGSGQYTLHYGSTETAMQALSPIGPFFWTNGEERHTLLASSETEFLWHRLMLDPAPAARVRFMKCTFRQ